MMFEDRLESIERELRRVLGERVPEELYGASAYLPLAGGKRLRPLLSLLSCEAFSDDYSRAMPLAISLELIHNFTLLHDDLMDRDALRRGVKTAHKVYGEPLAILAGDALYSVAFENMSQSYEGQLAKRLACEVSHMTLEICHGQALDLLYESSEASEEDYLRMIYKKTAIFFEKAALCGALVGGADETSAEDLAVMGKDLGMGFQMWDDLLSVIGNERRTGKSVGNDIRRGKKTMIILRAKSHGVELSVLGKENASDSEIRDAISQLESCGAVDDVRRMAEGYISDAERRAKGMGLRDFIAQQRGRQE